MKTSNKILTFVLPLFLFLQLVFVPLLFSNGDVKKGDLRQAKGSETSNLKMIPNDIEMVAGEHKNATVVLKLEGTTQECFNVKFTYNPEDPSIVPLDSFVMCPESPTTITPPQAKCKNCGSKGVRKETIGGLPMPFHSRPNPLLAVRQGWLGRKEEEEEDEVKEEENLLSNVTLYILSRRVGKTVMEVAKNSSDVDVTNAFVRVSVIHSETINVVSDVMGWMYTIIWNISFLPQVWLNWRRKSVEGFSFDNVTLNIIAYLYYSLFNIAFYAIPLIEDQFKERYPRSVSHVQINDVFFATYSLFIVSLEAVQCFLYGRNKGMRVSWPCIALVAASIVAVGVDCILVAVGVVLWLDVFYLMSYMKLIITPLKYIPQVHVIYRIKSTKGFSISGAVMDFTGGTLSLLQMFLLAANSNDYSSVFTNFSKFGLGIITLFFDFIYFCQHWYYHLRPGK